MFKILVGFAIYLIIWAIIPFLYQPTVSKQTENRIQQLIYSSDKPTEERAYILSDNGEALEERIRMLSQAKDRIILSTFEFRTDDSGKAVLSVLMTAAKRGVRVQVLVDGTAELTRMKGNKYFYSLSAMDNVEIRIYNPLSILRPWSIMGRLHDKYLIVDERLYILGGRNVYDYFLGDKSDYKNIDWDVLVYCEEAGQGESVKQLLSYFNSIWNQPECKAFASHGRLWRKASGKQAAQELHTIYSNMQQEYPDWFDTIDYYEKTSPVNHIQLISNPTTCYAKEPIVFYTITQLMQNANKEVIFHTPYIICNNWMLKELATINESVPKVTMMTNSLANNGNPFGAMDYQNNKKKILDTGIQVLEYDGGVSYHGKCFVIDHNLSAIGSFNWDMRSTYIDTELMLIIDSETINRDLREAMSQYEKQALIAKDEKNYIVPDGKIPQKISKKRRRRVKILQLIGRPFRFLM